MLPASGERASAAVLSVTSVPARWTCAACDVTVAEVRPMLLVAFKTRLTLSPADVTSTSTTALSGPLTPDTEYRPSGTALNANVPRASVTASRWSVGPLT